MTVLEKVRAKLTAATAVTDLVGSRIFPEKAEQGAVPSYIVITVVSDVPEASFDNTPEEQLGTARVQVDCYAKTYRDAHAVAKQVDLVVGALVGPELAATRENKLDLYDDEAELYRVSADFSVWTGY